jgi:hypothetical protein
MAKCVNDARQSVSATNTLANNGIVKRKPVKRDKHFAGANGTSITLQNGQIRQFSLFGSGRMV